MSIRNFVPEIWSARLIVPFMKALVFGALVNTDHEGEIKAAGDTVRINAVGPVTVSAYAGTTITYEDLNDEQQTLLIDQKNYFAYQVDDVDKAQALVGYMDQASQNAASAMANVVDAYIAGLYTAASSATASTAVNSANVYAAILSLAQALDEANVPVDGRWLTLPPWLKTKLVLAKLLVENTSNDAFLNGFVGRVAGFDVHISNNVNNDATTWNCMAGTRAAISYAGQFSEVEALRSETTFKDKVRGLDLFGAKVIQPDALAVLTATVAAE